jgi:acyl-CoA thioesterase-1
MWIVGVIVVAALAAYFFWPTSRQTITNYPSQGSDIIALGDSLTAGNGSTLGHDYVSLLSQDSNKPIVNLGVAGDTTADALKRIGELDQYKPKVVIVLLGGNDYLKRVPPEQTFANLVQIIQEIQKRGAIVLLVGVRGGVLRDNFADEFKKLSQDYHTAFVPGILDGIYDNTELKSDEIHPNDKGYAIMAARIAPTLKELLQ